MRPALAALVLFTACQPKPDSAPVEPSELLDAGVLEGLADGGVPSCEAFGDSQTMKAFEAEVRLIAGQSAPNQQGLSGQNKRYGRMVSARFQMGVGLLARLGVEVGDARLATSGLVGIEAGLATVDPNGVVVSAVPPDAPIGSTLKAQDVASAAAFFLGDACQGLSSLERAPAAWGLQARLDAARATVARALPWLDAQEEVLRRADGQAPNRLLFDARAFSTCGAFARLPRRPTAARFIDLALATQREDGVFVEGGGADTSYQGVAIAIGADLLAADAAPCEALRAPVLRAALWLGGRVDSSGRINSTGNTRTCGGGESFLGRPKDLDLSHALRGLAAVAVGSENAALLDVAKRVSRWAQTTTASCFP